MEKNDIFIIHGTDYKNMAKRVLEQAGVAADIGDTNKKVALKPNLVTAKAPSSGATTHGELLAGVKNTSRNTAFKTSPSWRVPGSETTRKTPSGPQDTIRCAAGTAYPSWICSAIPGRNTMREE